MHESVVALGEVVRGAAPGCPAVMRAHETQGPSSRESVHAET